MAEHLALSTSLIGLSSLGVTVHLTIESSLEASCGRRGPRFGQVGRPYLIACAQALDGELLQLKSISPFALTGCTGAACWAGAGCPAFSAPPLSPPPPQQPPPEDSPASLASPSFSLAALSSSICFFRSSSCSLRGFSSSVLRVVDLFAGFCFAFVSSPGLVSPGLVSPGLPASSGLASPGFSALSAAAQLWLSFSSALALNSSFLVSPDFLVSCCFWRLRFSFVGELRSFWKLSCFFFG